MQIEVSLLVDDLVLAFCLPTVFFLVQAAWCELSSPNGFSARKRRVALVLSLLFFVGFVAMIFDKDWDTLVGLWLASPLALSLVYLLCSLCIIALVAALFYWQLRPSKWKSDSGRWNTLRHWGEDRFN